MTEKKALAEIYHQETKYHEAEMAKHQRQLDWGAQPSPYKEYHSEKKIDLIPYLPFQNNPFTGEPLAPPKEEGGYPFGAGAISRLLYFTNGVTGILQYPNGQSLVLRAAPTAGGLYPTEIYLAIRGLSTLENGIYNFQVRDHSLIPVWEGDFWAEFEKYCVGHEAIERSNLLMILTAVYQRSAWRYQERAYRRILLDTGHILGNVVAYAPEEGFAPYPIGGFFDAPLNRLLFLEESEEGVLTVVALPQSSRIGPQKIHSAPAIASQRKKTGGEEDSQRLQLQLHRVSSISPDEEVDLSSVHSPPDIGLLESKYPHKEAIPLDPAPIQWEEGVGQTILLRRSARAFTGESILKEELASILEYAYQPLSFDPLPLFDPSLLETYLVIQKVDGLEPGVFYYAPQSRELRWLYGGDFRKQTWRLCLGQELARDAAAVVVHIAHLKRALEKYGDRAYRYLHLDAGHIGQRMNLAAVRLGIGASGIGGFYDDEVNALLGLSLDQIVVYITTLGKPPQLSGRSPSP
ncbi:MAG TPA: SagB/ThcOx family dehydrogenase [Candidatus Manganitrophaceae bacterium]|nr:SagB/ThcOx family dehydrogenase [Candidatus Manganitrophaceae bacterium]